MSTLADRVFPATLTTLGRLVEQGRLAGRKRDTDTGRDYLSEREQGIAAESGITVCLEAWTFDDEASRRKAGQLLFGKECTVKIRSAYKPLVHFFLEEADLHNLVRVRIVYPVHPECDPDRFLLEAYPLPALLPGVDIEFSAGEPAGKLAGKLAGKPADSTVDPETPLFYEVRMEYSDLHSETRQVFAPNRYLKDHTGNYCVASCGWLQERLPDGIMRGGPLVTDYEEIFQSAIDTLNNHTWPSTEPFFDRLSIQVTLPAADMPLQTGEEVLSLREALHEELYFSALELFQKRTGKTQGDRTIKPGQVVPEIVSGPVPSLKIMVLPLDRHDYTSSQDSASSQDSTGGGNPDSERERCEGKPVPDSHSQGQSQSPIPAPADYPDLDLLDHAPEPERIFSEVARIGGQKFEAQSYSGRRIAAVYHPGKDKAVMISGGQHANETTGIVGALRAARELATRQGSHFSVAPLENPDGYALHRLLCADNPGHMHHAARYTALGNDLEYQDDSCLYEKAIRHQAENLTGAKLHINLHGYPSHEWTRPLTGYIPRDFPAWTLPHGFFLVLRHHAGWKAQAETLVDRLTLALAQVPGLLRFTAGQLDLYNRFVKNPPFVIVNGFPCALQVREDSPVPLRLITEYPDETIHGPSFIAGHSAQKAAVLAAYEIFQELPVQ